MARKREGGFRDSRTRVELVRKIEWKKGSRVGQEEKRI